MASLYKAPTVNFKSNDLNGAINDSVTTITLTSTTDLQAPGYIVIDREDGAGAATPAKREVVSYTGISSNDLTGCSRGADGSTARSHSDGALVEATFTVGMWNNRMVVANNEPFQARDSGDAVQDLINLDASDVIVIGENNANDHTIINAGTDKLVKIKVLRQDVTTNAYKNNSIILTGWSYLQNDGTVSWATPKTITFGITFAAAPIVVGQYLGNKYDTAPTAIGQCTGAEYRVACGIITHTITTTNFIAALYAEYASGNANTFFGFSWIAIGQLN